MSLLREIQNAAVDPAATPLAVVLRKCMILASRLGHAPFKAWVDEELNGYARGADLPAYRRGGGVSSIGSFVGPFGASLSNVPLRLGPIPAELRERYQVLEFREGIAQLEEMAAGEGELISRWSGDLVAKVEGKFFEGFSLIEAHKEIPRSAVVGVLDAVRNRILKFSLEIEEQEPGAGDGAPGAKPLPEERVSQIFNTFIMGAAQNVAVGSPAAVQHAQQIQAGDLVALRRVLAAQGVQEADLDDLEGAIKEDPAPRAGEPLGRRVSSWLANMLSKAGAGAWNVGTSAAGQLLTAALKAYYGLE
jgi:hypothetical protein